MSRTVTTHDWEEQETQVNRFVARFGNPDYRLLVDYAALPLVLTPELVHYLRTEFLRDKDVPWEAEVDLLLSDLCTQVGYELYAMDTQVRAYVLDQMQGDEVWQQRKQAVAQILISYVNILSRVDPKRRIREREAQRWAAMMYLGDERCQEAVQDIAERLKQLGDWADTGANAEHSIRAELARLTRIVQEMASELREGAASSLLDYAEVVQTVLRCPDEVAALQVQQSYRVGDVELTVSPRIWPEQREQRVDSNDLDGFPRLRGLEFETGQCVVGLDTGPDAEFPALVERSVEVVTFIPEDDQVEASAVASEELEQGAADASGVGLRSFSFEVVTLGGSPERETKQGQLYEEPIGDDGVLEMVSILAGHFTMGSSEEEPERYGDEGPQHEVEVPAFFMGRYPVTQAQYEGVMGSNPAEQYDWEQFVAPDKPVVGVSWDDAVEFCQRLSQYTQKTYRLPSEAEWEYACRAGTTTPFHFGDMISPDVANYRGSVSYNGGATGEYREKTVSVNHFQIANRFGLSDMHGNVWEWCQDHWHENYEGSPPDDGSAWLENTLQNNIHVRRGGSWVDYPQHCRSAARSWDASDVRNPFLGFRVVASAPRTQ